MRRRLFRWVLAVAALAPLAGCSGGGGGSSTSLALPASLGFAAALQTVNDGLGTGAYAQSVSQAITPPLAVFTEIDAFLSFMGTLSIPITSATFSAGTAYGALQIDFSALTTVSVDADGDGTNETVTCSRTATSPSCAWLWLDAEPFAFLVTVEAASGSSLGNGVAVFLAEPIGQGEAGTSVNFQWIGTSSDKSANVYMTGSAGTTATATIAHISMARASSASSATNTLKSSGRWTAHPMSCETTESILGFVTGEDYLSIDLSSDVGCSVQTGLTCVRISSATEASTMSFCGDDISGESFAALPDTAALAALPSNFPPTPTF